MPTEPFSCNEARSALAEIESLKTDFERIFEEAQKTGDLARAKELRSKLQGKINVLREAIFPLERESGLKDQYESQRRILEEAGVLKRLSLSEGEEMFGIHGIDGKEYLMPSYREIAQKMREMKEILIQKKEQGFTKLLIVPFGMSLDNLTQEYGNLLLKYHNEGKLSELNVSEPVWRWSEYADADVNGKLVYEPKEFSQNHGGKTKAQILKGRTAAEGRQSPAWRVLMVEANPDIPRENQGKEIGMRKQLEANKTPNEYLRDIGQGAYDHESGMTPEDWLAYAITNLKEKNEVIDDYQGTGSIAYNIGAYFPGSKSATGYVPDAYWFRGDQQAYLYRDVPADRDDFIGARSAVRVY